MSAEGNTSVSLAATDVFEHQLKKDRLTILGWDKSMLLRHALVNPVLSVVYLLFLLKARELIPQSSSLLGFFFKGLFIHYASEAVQPDVVHLHEAYSWLYIKMIPQRIKIVATFHGPYGISETVPYHETYSVLERKMLTCRRVSMVYFISHDLEKEFRKSYSEINVRIATILNAFDNTTFHYIVPREHTSINLCTIGTIQDRKGQIRVIEGLAQANSKYNYYTIGDGKEEQIKEMEAYGEKLDVSIHHLGKLEPNMIRERLADMDYMILPSSSEGFGLVYLESISCGVPVILPKDLPIVKEQDIIKQDVNALLLDNHSAESISKVIKDLGNYKFDHQKVANSIRGKSWTDIARQYLTTYKDL